MRLQTTEVNMRLQDWINFPGKLLSLENRFRDNNFELEILKMIMLYLTNKIT